MAKKIYWAICVLAFILAAYYAPQMVEYEWGAGAYIAIGWGVFLVLMGIVSLFAPHIEKYLDKKSN